MMSVGMHFRLLGRPAAFAAPSSASWTTLRRREQGLRSYSRIDIARHWQLRHPAPACRTKSASMLGAISASRSLF